jgi:AraC-like DNA-binding protein
MTTGCSETEAIRERMVGATAARALMDFAISKGAARAVLVERSGIDPAQLRIAENRIPFAQYVALMKAGKELCKDSSFALHFGESDEGVEATFACMMGVFSPTVREGFSHLAVDGSDGLSSEGLRLTRHGEQIWAVNTWNDDFPEGKESSFARVVCAARRLFGKELVKAVHFTHSEPPYRAEYDRIFRMPIVFRSNCDALVMDAAWLQQMTQAPSSHVLEMMKARAATLIQNLESAHSTRSRVEALLANSLHTTDVSIDAVAAKLGMGRHTLFRKLRSEGVTFKQVLDELRQKLANQYLCERNLAVNEAAYLLGFSDPTALSRAYKRWTGHSPRRVR